jgi:hypothetical protein
MMNYTFTKATKEQSKLRLAIFGPSGAGKTFTALRLATGIGGEVAVIDTERGSASKYADRFTFDVLELPADHRDIEAYCAAIKAAQQNGYAVLIIDSLTHGWRELLAEVDKIARAKYRGNTWSAWSEGTPKQRRLVNAILDFDGHVIATMRTKTEWTTGSDGKGKTRPVRVGLAPEQGKGIEYEFDMLMEINPEHDANVIKDRTGKYQDEIIAKPGEGLGKALAEWLKEGAPPTQKPTPETQKAGGDGNAPKPKPEPTPEETATRARWLEYFAKQDAKAQAMHLEVGELRKDANGKIVATTAEVQKAAQELADRVKRAEALARWEELLDKAQALGLKPEGITDKTPYKTIVRRGKALAEEIKKAEAKIPAGVKE